MNVFGKSLVVVILVPVILSVVGTRVYGADEFCAMITEKADVPPATRDVRKSVQDLKAHIASKVLHQEELIDGLLISLLIGGNIIVEGPPGTGKTRVMKTLAGGIQGLFSRIQGMPDLMPKEIVGENVRNPDSGKLEFEPGPVLANLILVDEINRIPPRTQAALLEAMEEGQVTLNKVTRKLPDIHMFVATENPYDAKGTFELPEAQLDRFIMNIILTHPDANVESEIVDQDYAERLAGKKSLEAVNKLSLDDIDQARRQVLDVRLPKDLQDYVIRLVSSTRPDKAEFPESMREVILSGAGPRTSIGLTMAARAHAYLAGRTTATIADVDAVAHAVLRHRIHLHDTSKFEGRTVDNVIDDLLKHAKEK